MAVRVAQEASTVAEIVETVIERELAAIDPDLLKPPSADDPSSTKGDWITNMRPLMDVANAAMDAGEVTTREAYREALREGSSNEEALERAIIAVEAYGGTKSADQVIAAGPDGLIDDDDDDAIIIAGGSGGFWRMDVVLSLEFSQEELKALWEQQQQTQRQQQPQQTPTQARLSVCLRACELA